MLTIRELVKVYPGPVTALSGINLEVPVGMFGQYHVADLLPIGSAGLSTPSSSVMLTARPMLVLTVSDQLLLIVIDCPAWSVMDDAWATLATLLPLMLTL